MEQKLRKATEPLEQPLVSSFSSFPIGAAVSGPRAAHVEEVPLREPAPVGVSATDWPSQQADSSAASAADSDKDRNQKSIFLRWYHGFTGGNWGTDPDDLDLEYVSAVVERLGAFFGPGRYFGVEAKGMENIPDEPSLLVSNHSGGAAAPDAWGLMLSWHKHFAAKRPIHALAHEMVLSIKATGEPFSKLGVLRADPGMAMKVLTEWRRDVAVMPGGDVEVFRPYKDRYKVDFAERRGYIKLALKAGVPIVPVANAGAHETLMVLTDGQAIARRLKLDKLFRLKVFPIHLSFPWGLAIGPFPHLPPPTLLRYRFGPPVPAPARLAPGEEPSEALIRDYDARVQRAIQNLLDQLKAEAPQRRQHLLDICKQLYRSFRSARVSA